MGLYRLSVPALFTALIVGITLAPESAQSQRRITGRVTAEETGEPVPGVAISVVNTPFGALTNDNGGFSVVLPEGAQSLLVRRIGYKRRIIPVEAAQSEVNVPLQRDALQLEAQIITGAATTIARRNAANDVAQVTSDQIANVQAPSLENALSGRIAGAQVIANSGAPGGGNQVRLRGVTSVFGSSDPLYVIDGVIVSNDAIQPGINAISAANRNTSNSTNQDNGVNRIADINPNDIERIDVLKGASASAIYGSKASNGVIIITTKTGRSRSTGGTGISVIQRFGTRDLSGKFGHRRFTLDEARAYGANVGLTQAEVDANFNSCGGFCDHEEELFGERPVSFETNISVRGGSEATNYFASLLNLYDGGIQRNTGYRKQSVRLNVNHTVNDKLSLQFNNNLIRTLTRRGISNNDNSGITPYFIFAGTPSWFDVRPEGSVYPATPVLGSNPLQNADFIQTPEEVYRLISSASASYGLYTSQRHSLQLKLDGGVDRYNQQVNVVSPRFLLFEGNDGLPGTVTSLSGNVLNANANFSAVHNYYPASGTFSATTSAGVQREINMLRSANVVTRDVLLGQENVNRGAATEVFADRQEIRGLALFAQEEVLAFQERLLATAGVRLERSTVNGDIDKFYAFPKGSLSYRWENPFSSVDEFKTRIAVGQSGNQPLYIQKYTPALGSTYDGQNALQSGLISGNPDIKPERQTEVEGGFDATLLSGRASLSFTLYQKTIDDVIFHIVTAPSQGFQVDIENGGSIHNRGVEIFLTATPYQTPSFSWLGRMTFARNVGVVTGLPSGVTAFNAERDATGQRVAFGPGYGIGRLEVGERVTQIIGSGCDGACLERRGDSAPDFTLGIGNDFTWKGFRLSALFDWQHGGDLVNVTHNVYDAFGTAPDREDGGAGRARENDVVGNAQYIYDASFVKLRELAVGYELPTSLTSRLFFGAARSARVEVS
ncbi:MAG: SusC/RagA family TonB-linked outer membrane protein, partial [Anaerolineae bacterium]|nr:SusC/RagA family TonB-linked outer membrane protein [Gemmatimonadaceae bacterium]